MKETQGVYYRRSSAKFSSAVICTITAPSHELRLRDGPIGLCVLRRGDRCQKEANEASIGSISNWPQSSDSASVQHWICFFGANPEVLSERTLFDIIQPLI